MNWRGWLAWAGWLGWRGWLAWAGAGSALTLGRLHDWLAAVVATACVTVLAAWWVRGEFAATRARMRLSAERQDALDSVVTASRLAAKKAA